ncbi:MAG: PEP-CTERM sorting domain-containing protein [Planctomycetota bacterium]|jgi:hypothetical protein
MKTKLSVGVILLVLVTCGQAYAVGDKIFTSSGQILPGEEWNNVSIYNDDTVVDMLGGNVDSMGSHDASTLNVFDGFVSTLVALEFSRINVSGGHVQGLSALDWATVIFSGTASVVSLSASGESGLAQMVGGTAEYVRAGDSGTLELYGGLVSDSLNAFGSSAVYIFGYDLVKTSSGGAYGYGQVYGAWLDQTPFNIDFSTQETYLHVNLVPEPSSLLLLAGGLLLLRR